MFMEIRKLPYCRWDTVKTWRLGGLERLDDCLQFTKTERLTVYREGVRDPVVEEGERQVRCRRFSSEKIPEVLIPDVEPLFTRLPRYLRERNSIGSCQFSNDVPGAAVAMFRVGFLQRSCLFLHIALRRCSVSLVKLLFCFFKAVFSREGRGCSVRE